MAKSKLARTTKPSQRKANREELLIWRYREARRLVEEWRDARDRAERLLGKYTAEMNQIMVELARTQNG